MLPTADCHGPRHSKNIPIGNLRVLSAIRASTMVVGFRVCFDFQGRMSLATGRLCSCYCPASRFAIHTSWLLIDVSERVERREKYRKFSGTGLRAHAPLPYHPPDFCSLAALVPHHIITGSGNMPHFCRFFYVASGGKATRLPSLGTSKTFCPMWGYESDIFSDHGVRLVKMLKSTRNHHASAHP